MHEKKYVRETQVITDQPSVSLKAVIRVCIVCLVTILLIPACSGNELSRNKAKQIIEKSPASIKKVIQLHANGMEAGIQHDLWLTKPSFWGSEPRLTEKGAALIENINNQSLTMKESFEIEVDISGIADAVLPLTNTKGVKEVLFKWRYTNIPTPIKWVISQGGNGKAYFRLYDDGWRLEGFEDIKYDQEQIHLSGTEAKEEQSDKEVVAKKRDEMQRAEAERMRKEEELRLKEQDRIIKLTNESKTPLQTIGSFKCINITVTIGAMPQADGEAILTDVDASYVHLYKDHRGIITNKVNVIFWFGNIQSIYKQDADQYRVSFKLKNPVVIRPGDHAYAIWFQDRQIRDDFYNKIIKAKDLWDKKYPELK